MKIHETEPKLRAAALPALGLGSGLRSLARKRCVLANENSPRKSRRILHRSLTSRERPADGGRSVTLRGEIQGAHTPRHLTQTLRTRASVARTGFCLPISGVPFESSDSRENLVHVHVTRDFSRTRRPCAARAGARARTEPSRMSRHLADPNRVAEPAGFNSRRPTHLSRGPASRRINNGNNFQT